MPLTELMNYFNDQLQSQARTKSLPATGFYKADNAYWARFGSLTLGSQFHQIRSLNDEKIIGYESELAVRASTGNLLNIDSIFNSLDSLDQIIHLDRLVRTLHSINYLQQYDGQNYLLSLQVQPRHIVSVSDDHGKTFEGILSDCGLKPERVLLHTRLLDVATLPHFQKALGSYRRRGYKIGVFLTQARELNLLASLELEPDVIFFDYTEFKQTPALSNQNLSGIKIVVGESKQQLTQVEKPFDGYLISARPLFEHAYEANYLLG